MLYTHLRGHHILGHPVHFVGKLFVVQRIEFQTDIVDLQTERTLVAGARRHRHAHARDLVERNATLFVLHTTLGGQKEFGEGDL